MTEHLVALACLSLSLTLAQQKASTPSLHHAHFHCPNTKPTSSGLAAFSQDVQKMAKGVSIHYFSISQQPK